MYVAGPVIELGLLALESGALPTGLRGTTKMTEKKKCTIAPEQMIENTKA